MIRRANELLRRGRIRRPLFAVLSTAAYAAFAVAGFFAFVTAMGAHPQSYHASPLVLGPLALLTGVLLALAVVIEGSRLHDLGRSAWWTVGFHAAAVGLDTALDARGLNPALSGAWVLALCLWPGDPGANRFGPAPASSWRFGVPAAALGVALALLTTGCTTPDRRDDAARIEPAISADAPASEVAATIAAPEGARPAEWAQPIAAPGLPNLHRISPLLYRGAQPTRAGWAELERLGVRTVLSLRAFHADEIPDGIALASKRISFKSWHPEDEDVERFLAIVTDPALQPVFVHCQHGADRTGTMCAIHRIVVEGWSKDEAVREMVGGGYGFHAVWSNLVDYVRDLDVDTFRASGDLSRTSR